jgi:hypothetical protein
MNGRTHQPFALIALIDVTYSLLPGWIVLSLPFRSKVVITFEVEITPI